MMNRWVSRRDFLRVSAAGTAALGSGLLSSCGEAGDTDSGLAQEANLPLEPELYDPTTPWWLQGNYAPIHSEMRREDLEVIGEIPAELNGTYLRNGPNPLNSDSGHWFLGDGMIHGVKLEDGQAKWYQNRYIQTDLLSGDAPTSGFPTLATHQANTSIIHHGNKLLTLSEVGLPYEVSTDDLSTRGLYDFNGNLATAMTAHPKVDPSTGELIFFGYSWQAPYLTYHIANSAGELIKSEILDVAGPSMQHDFAITETRSIFMDMPILFDLNAAMEGMSLPFVWTPSYGARIGIMPRYGTNSDLTWFEIDNCFVFHIANAYDVPQEPDTVIIEGYRFETFNFDETIHRADRSYPQLWRWTLNLANGTVQEEQLLERFADFPMIDPRQVGRYNRYLYSVQFDLQDFLGTDGGFVAHTEGIQRYDRQTGEVILHEFGPRFRTDEVIFVPKADGDEGEGWLLSFVYDRARQTSALSILDANDIEGAEAAMVYLPQRVPHGFHGTWVPER